VAGPQGNQGPAGAKGDAGPQGKDGPLGISTIPGPQGPQGFQGPAPSASVYELIDSSPFIAGHGGINFNDCFTATYDVYMIVFSCVPTGTVDLWFRLRQAGGDQINNQYAYVGFDHSTSSVGMNNKGDPSATYWPITFQLTANSEAAGEILVFDPANPSRTRMISRSMSMNGVNSVSQCEMTGIYKAAGGYDGFTLTQSTGSMAAGGYCRVYGMRKS